MVEGSQEEFRCVGKKFLLAPHPANGTGLSGRNEQLFPALEFCRGQVIDFNNQRHDIASTHRELWGDLTRNRPEALPGENGDALVARPHRY